MILEVVDNLASLKSLNGVKLNNINPNQRSETLNVSDWIKLAENFK